MGETMVYARVPQRISTVAPLSEVTLGGQVWIRTADNRLWLAPTVGGVTACPWGYGGGT
jgi:hypothetical protein